MSTLDPSIGTQDLAERVARARQQLARDETGYILKWDELSQEAQRRATSQAAKWLDAICAVGLAVVELPEARVSSRYTLVATGAPMFNIDVPSPDGRGWEITGQHIHGCPADDRVAVEGGIGWNSTGRARIDALRILAACDAVERLRDEHQTAPEHDGSGPPVCEPCSADCPACAAEHQGGEPR